MPKLVLLNTHRSLLEAKLDEVTLQAAGITSEVRGDMRPALQGLVGLAESRVELLVAEEDLERATEVLATSKQSGVGDTEQVCPSCSERSPATFGSCWRCGGPLSTADVVDAVPPSTSAASHSPVAPKRRLNVATLLLSLVVVVLAVCLVRAEMELSGWRTLIPGVVVNLEEGCWVQRDVETHYKLIVACDEDFDGNPEHMVSFRPDGVLEWEVFDLDDDGEVDRERNYDASGKLVNESVAE